MKRTLKRILKVIAVIVVVVLVGGGWAGWQVDAFNSSMARSYDVPLAQISRSTDPAVLERGKHLAESIGACASKDCHGGDFGGGGGRRFAPPLNGSTVMRIRVRSMNNIIIVTVAVAAVGSWIAFRAHARNPRSSGTAPSPKKDSADAGRGLRLMMLTTPPKEFGVKPTKEFPRVYAILIDWQLREELIATVFSSSTGAASLYTTSTFGVIGGEGHDTVRAAAKALVRASDRHFTAARPTTEFPYPREGHVRFYFLTFDGVRVIDTDLATITSGTSKYAEMFGLGQAVLTELRRVTEKRQ